MTKQIEAVSSNRDAIEAYEISDGSIILTDEQETLRERWIFADEAIRRWTGIHGREAIASMIRHRFDVSRATAFSDIRNAEMVYSSSTPLNKKYTIQRRIELAEKTIAWCLSQDDTDNAAKWEKLLQGYIEQYPDDMVRDASKSIVYNLSQTTIVHNVQPVATAEEIINLPLNNPDNE